MNDFSTVVKVTGVVPKFTQTPVSYMVLSGLPDLNNPFEILVSFKPEAPDGLILFSGEVEKITLQCLFLNVN